MEFLKLAALDEDDLTVISACMQDAVVKTGEISFKPKAKRLILTANRFAWEKQGDKLSVPERRRSVLHFDRVMSVKASGVDKTMPEEVLSILAIRPVEGSSGQIDILFAGYATMRLDVECIEVQLADLGSAWAAKGRPKHGA
jgi:hypothetical protein